MQKSEIEWTDYTSNPIKGYCPVACSYCYGLRMYDRFKWDKTIRFIPEELGTWRKAKPGSKIFVGSMIELFGSWVHPEWLEAIFSQVRLHPEIIFQFLTKRPQNLPKTFPDNCWVGVTATNTDMAFDAINHLDDVHANVRFISFEPLLAPINLVQLDVHLRESINLVIIGQQTPIREATTPNIEWIEEIVRAADSAGISIFLKDNLKPLILKEEKLPIWAMEKWERHDFFNLRQEMPKEVK